MAVMKVLFCVYICLFKLRNSLQDVIYKMVVYRINRFYNEELSRPTTSPYMVYGYLT